jgi:hypothetical protein
MTTKTKRENYASEVHLGRMNVMSGNLMKERYRILRFFSDGRPAKRIKVVPTLKLAKLHCRSPLTQGILRLGVKWFGGFIKI